MLTAVAGFVDAVAYTRVTGVFPANQSGNLILLGLVVGGTPGAPAARTAGAIAAFAVGVVVAALVALGWPWGCSRDHQPGGRGGREHHLRDGGPDASGGAARASRGHGHPRGHRLALGVATYVGGAAAGASIAAHWARPLTVPVAVLAALVLVHALRSRSAPG